MDSDADLQENGQGFESESGIYELLSAFVNVEYALIPERHCICFLTLFNSLSDMKKSYFHWLEIRRAQLNHA